MCGPRSDTCSARPVEVLMRDSQEMMVKTTVTVFGADGFMMVFGMGMFLWCAGFFVSSALLLLRFSSRLQRIFPRASLITAAIFKCFEDCCSKTASEARGLVVLVFFTGFLPVSIGGWILRAVIEPVFKIPSRYRAQVLDEYFIIGFAIQACIGFAHVCSFAMVESVVLSTVSRKTREAIRQHPVLSALFSHNAIILPSGVDVVVGPQGDLGSITAAFLVSSLFHLVLVFGLYFLPVQFLRLVMPSLFPIQVFEITKHFTISQAQQTSVEAHITFPVEFLFLHVFLPYFMRSLQTSNPRAASELAKKAVLVALRRAGLVELVVDESAAEAVEEGPVLPEVDEHLDVIEKAFKAVVSSDGLVELELPALTIGAPVGDRLPPGPARDWLHSEVDVDAMLSHKPTEADLWRQKVTMSRPIYDRDEDSDDSDSMSAVDVNDFSDFMQGLEMLSSQSEVPQSRVVRLMELSAYMNIYRKAMSEFVHMIDILQDHVDSLGKSVTRLEIISRTRPGRGGTGPVSRTGDVPEPVLQLPQPCPVELSRETVARVILLVTMCFAVVFMIVCIAVALPLVVGRALVSACFPAYRQDYVPLRTGLTVVGVAVLALMRSLEWWPGLRNTGFTWPRLFQEVCRARGVVLGGVTAVSTNVLCTVSTAVLLSVWFVGLPVLLGGVFHLAAIAPLLVETHQTCVLFPLHCWGAGLIVMKVIFRLVQINVALPELRAAVSALPAWSSLFYSLSMHHALWLRVMPIVLECAVTHVAQPYFVSMVLSECMPTVWWNVLARKYTFHVMQATRLLCKVAPPCARLIAQAYQTFFDSRYLVARRVMNQ